MPNGTLIATTMIADLTDDFPSVTDAMYVGSIDAFAEDLRRAPASPAIVATRRTVRL